MSNLHHSAVLDIITHSENEGGKEKIWVICQATEPESTCLRANAQGQRSDTEWGARHWALTPAWGNCSLSSCLPMLQNSSLPSGDIKVPHSGDRDICSPGSLVGGQVRGFLFWILNMRAKQGYSLNYTSSEAPTAFICQGYYWRDKDIKKTWELMLKDG